uniref:Uncharacterized protein n=1 Tax=Bradyrhizobium japonicum TaxID=375 RepID=Q9RHC6_BRAJP|nr:unknown [Bradyrhizobium japonicum]
MRRPVGDWLRRSREDGRACSRCGGKALPTRRAGSPVRVGGCRRRRRPRRRRQFSLAPTSRRPRGIAVSRSRATCTVKPAARGAEQAAAIPAPRKRLGGPADHLRNQQQFESHSYRFWSNILNT